jgi:hypothetical protein
MPSVSHASAVYASAASDVPMRSAVNLFSGFGDETAVERALFGSLVIG